MSNPIQEKFGKVYVPNHGAGGKGYQVMRGVKFSNLKFQVLKDDTKEEIYSGHRFHVGALGVRLRIPLPLGRNIIPDMEMVAQAGLKEVDMAKKLKIIGINDTGDQLKRKQEMVRNAAATFYYALTIPGYEWMEHDFPYVSGVLTLLDDMLESFGNDEGENFNENDRQTCTYRLVSHIADILSDLIQTTTSESFSNLIKYPLQLLQIACDENNALKPMIAKYKQSQLDRLRGILKLILNAVSSIRSAAISMALKKFCSPEGFLYQTGIAIKSFSLQYSREWHNEIMSNENAKLMLPTMVALRQTSVAANFTLESAFLIQGIQLGKRLRDTTLFKLIYDKICSHTQKLNDIFSFEKEIDGVAEEWRNNEACVLHRIAGISKSDALTKLAEDANSTLDQLEVLSKLLIETWKDTEEQTHVEHFVAVLKRHVAAHIRWDSLLKRYHENLILDCYIDEL